MYLDYLNSFINIDNGILFSCNNMEFYQLENKHLEVIIKKNNGLTMSDDEINIIKEMDEICKPEVITNQNKRTLEDIKSIKIHVSNDCNLRCSYCYAESGNYGADKAIMSRETALNLAQIIKNKLPNINTILFFGGEPLMATDAIQAICESFYKQNILFLLQTNGTIYNEKIHALIKKYDIKVTVSIDGPKEIHDIHRIFPNGRGSYDTIVKNVLKLNEGSESVCYVQGTYTKQASEKLSKNDIVEQIYKDFKIPRISMYNVITNDDDMKVENKSVISAEGKANKFFNDVMNGNINNNDTLKLILSSILSQKRNDFFCNAGHSQMSIDHNGGIWPCQLFTNHEEYNMGNIYDNLDKNNCDFNNAHIKVGVLKKENHDDCMNCLASFWCRKCVFQSLMKEEELTIPKDYCDYYSEITDDVLMEMTKLIENNMYDDFVTNFQSIYSMELL